MFFIFFCSIIILEIKKNIIVLVNENHDRGPRVTPVQHFCSGFDHANLVSSLVVPNIYPTLDTTRRLGIGHIFRTGSSVDTLL